MKMTVNGPKTYTWEEIQKSPGLYKSEGYFFLVTAQWIGQSYVLFASGGTLEPAAEAWKTGVFTKVCGLGELELTKVKYYENHY